MRIALLTALFLASLPAVADECRFSAERVLDIDAQGLSLVKLDTGAGDLDVVGVAGLERIEVRGKACVGEESSLSGLQLFQQREGTTASISTRIPDGGYTGFLFGSHYAYIDVHVRMPAALKLELRDSSGDLEVAGLQAGLDLGDSSGDIVLHDLAGTVTVADSSGDIDVRRVTGILRIDSDSSGDIAIADVKGDASVREDSSGDIAFRDVSGRAEVGRDSSGDIEFDTIGGDASVGADGSGDIRATQVGGDFIVGRKARSDDNIRYAQVSGKVSIPPID